MLIWFSPTFLINCFLFLFFLLLYLVIGTTQRRSIGLTFYFVRITTFAPYFLQMLFWVDVIISSQSSFDKIVTSFFWSTSRRRRDENWLHEAQPLVSHTTFKISNVLQASIPQRCVYVCSCRTPSCSSSVCWHPRSAGELPLRKTCPDRGSSIGFYYPSLRP